jgi:FkbM family methyltransferase
MQQQFKTFDEIFKSVPQLSLLDVGSNPLESQPIYLHLLQRGHATLIGFEPGEKAYAQLKKMQSPRETYYPYAIGDGTIQDFYECQFTTMSSIFEPDPELLKHFHVLDEAGKVIAKHRMETKRLDDIPGIARSDFIHMDIQGAELQALQGGERLLKTTKLLQVETCFLQMYKKQPMFSEVELYLREQGFMFHRMVSPAIRTWRPLNVGGDMFTGWSQLFWADAIFVRNVTTWDQMSAEDLTIMAFLLHDLYKAFDLVYLALVTCDRLHGTQQAAPYFAYLKQNVPQLTQPLQAQRA